MMERHNISGVFPVHCSRPLVAVVLAACCAPCPVSAGVKIVPLWPGVPPGSAGITETEKVVERGDGKRVVDRSIHDVHRPTLTIHQPDQRPSRPLAALVICPGGGLTRIVIDKEGNDLARFLAPHGIVGVVLKFRTARTTGHFYGMGPMEADVRRAIRMVRARAKEWQIDPNKVGVFGFSAGGILAGSAATRHEPGNPRQSDPVMRHPTRPDFFAAAYPLLTMKTEVAGSHYQQLLFGKVPTAKQLADHSCDLNVTRRTPPSFLAHARDDRGVLVDNTLLFATACRKAGVSCTTFIRDKGGHGYGVRDLGTPINKWRFAFVDWLKQHKLTTPAVKR